MGGSFMTDSYITCVLCSSFVWIWCTESQLVEENFNVGYLEEENAIWGSSYAQLFPTESLRFEGFSEEQTPRYTSPSLEDKMPFLQMLQAVETPLLTQEPSLQFLLRLLQQEQKQQKKQLLPWESGGNSSYLTSFELESCVTNNGMLELHFPGISDGKHPQIQLRSEWNCQPDKSRDFSFSLGRAQGRSKQNQLPRSTPPATKERRKRKRTRPLKNIEEVESQRLTHITVERNRRRQMNDHLNELRCLLPPSYVHRGEQASIIGGAIEFVKALEHLLQSLQAQKRMRQKSEENGDASSNSCSSSSSSSNLFNLFGKSQEDGIFAAEPEGRIEDFTAENRSSMADIEAVVIHNHANVKIKCRKRCGQLVKAILALEELRLTVLHLNIISYESFVHYSFNLQKEDDCQLKSADMIVGAVYHIFSLINGC
ncbi:hypothetical protein Nepgr_023615 [Nepenthes gracilis]|uniref:BHLH domain-containing protein n=1 Tax=Nepenthes gracilis TaxID=150966 RepID=A0AAD3T2G1_NEPGR|nr:hypothetical protein Nepgr_023615 [Nepenthes gracilis]